MGLNRTLMGRSPSYSPLPLASTYACPLAASAIAAALIAREVTGLGDQIEVPLAACLHDTLVSKFLDPSHSLSLSLSLSLCHGPWQCGESPWHSAALNPPNLK